MEADSPKLTEEKAFEVIWFLQEVTRIFPDYIEKCDDCGDLFDSNSEGTYIGDPEEAFDVEDLGKHFCEDCKDRHVKPYQEEE